MDSGFRQQVLTRLAENQTLRIRDGQGRHLTVVQGMAWVTQDGDPHDVILASGESFTFDRPGLAIVDAFNSTAVLVLEHGLVAESVESGTPVAASSRPAHGPDLFRRPRISALGYQQIEREARRMRAEAISSLVHQLAIVLRRLWANVRKFPRTFRTRTAARTPQ